MAATTEWAAMVIDSLLSADGLAVLMAVLLGCFVKGALGFGLPLIATPIMLFVLPLPEIVAILALPITIANIQQIWLNRKQWQILRQFWPLITSSTLVMLVGAPLMVAIDSRLLGILIGLMIALHAILSSFPRGQFQNKSLSSKTMNHLIIPAGIVSGILGSLTAFTIDSQTATRNHQPKTSCNQQYTTNTQPLHNQYTTSQPSRADDPIATLPARP